MIEVYNCWTVCLRERVFPTGDLSVTHSFREITEGFKISREIVKKKNPWVFLEPAGAFIVEHEENLSGTIFQAGISKLPITRFLAHHDSLSNSQKALRVFPKDKQQIKLGKNALVCIIFDGSCGLSYGSIHQMGLKAHRVINYRDCKHHGNGGKFVSWLIYEMLDGERVTLGPGFINHGGKVTKY
jgi:hypothetical protein